MADMINNNANRRPDGLTRRQFLKAAMIGGAALGGSALLGRSALAGQAPATASAPGKAPNVLLIITDQQSIDTISALGYTHVTTPNMDRLVRKGVSFTQNYCTNPVCSPARSSIVTGRMPCETGVIMNEISVRPEMPNLGQWLSKSGYDTVYAGKWHLGGGTEYSTIPGFRILPGGLQGQGTLMDPVVSASCEAFLKGYQSEKPFFLAAGLMQPHDICFWVAMNASRPDVLAYPELEGKLPPLPANFKFDPNEPAIMAQKREKNSPKWTEKQWRFYLWNYYRMVEEADAEVGRILNALEDSGRANDTLVILTADHGEGMGKHQMVLKSYLYDDVTRVPLVISYPGCARENQQETKLLTSGVDIVPTICDYAGVKCPPDVRGLSLRPALEGREMKGHEYVVSETSSSKARLIRTADYKYVLFEGDPVEQLFDLANDPGETRNLIADKSLANVVEQHRSLNKKWLAEMIFDPNPMKRKR